MGRSRFCCWTYPAFLTRLANIRPLRGDFSLVLMMLAFPTATTKKREFVKRMIDFKLARCLLAGATFQANINSGTFLSKKKQKLICEISKISGLLPRKNSRSHSIRLPDFQGKETWHVKTRFAMDFISNKWIKVLSERVTGKNEKRLTLAQHSSGRWPRHSGFHTCEEDS